MGLTLSGFGVHAVVAVLDHGVVVPTAFPQFVADVHVLVGDHVTVVVVYLVLEAKVAGRVG